MDRRRMMMLAGFGALAAVIPTATSGAAPARPAGAYLFHDEFDGPAGSAPDPSKWVVANHRTPINNPTGFDRPEFFGQYRDSRQNVFVDGKSNLVLRATRDGGSYFGGLVSGTWRGAIGTTWEARIKLNCLAGGCWPAWWLSNDDPGRSGEVDLMEWYGNGQWPSGTTVHANPDGTAFETRPIAVDGAWHNWRVTWNPGGMYFWRRLCRGRRTVLQRSGDRHRGPPRPDPDVAVQRRRLHVVSDAEPRGRRCGRRRPRSGRLPGGNAGRLGAGLLMPQGAGCALSRRMVV